MYSLAVVAANKLASPEYSQDKEISDRKSVRILSVSHLRMVLWIHGLSRITLVAPLSQICFSHSCTGTRRNPCAAFLVTALLRSSLHSDSFSVKRDNVSGGGLRGGVVVCNATLATQLEPPAVDFWQ